MQNNVHNFIKGLRAFTVSSPITPSRQTVFLKGITIAALKQRTVHWEPTINLRGLTLNEPNSKGNKEENLFHMVTFSTFDPGASHPLLLSNALPMPIPSLTAIEPQQSKLVAPAAVQSPSTTSASHHTIEIQQFQPVCNTPKFRPWPYSLPKALQPRTGTTYDLMYGDGFGGGPVGSVKLSMLQRVLYGVPEPGVDASVKGK